MSIVRTDTSALKPTQVDFTVFEVTVSRVQRLSADFVRVTFAGDSLADFHFAGLDQRIKIIFPLPGFSPREMCLEGDTWYSAWRDLPDDQRCPMRTYTVRATHHGEFDVDFVVHGDSGPATRWVNRVEVGAEVLIVGPDARTLVEGDGPVGGVEFRPGAAKRILLAGDETAAPAICSIIESLPAGTRGQAFIEVASDNDILPVAGPGSFTVTWLSRDTRPPLSHGQALDRAVRAWVGEMIVAHEQATPAEVDIDSGILWEVPAATSDRDLYSWIAGEAGMVKELRRFLVRDAGIDRADVAFMGYWRVGRSES